MKIASHCQALKNKYSEESYLSRFALSRSRGIFKGTYFLHQETFFAGLYHPHRFRSRVSTSSASIPKRSQPTFYTSCPQYEYTRLLFENEPGDLGIYQTTRQRASNVGTIVLKLPCRDRTALNDHQPLSRSQKQGFLLVDNSAGVTAQVSTDETVPASNTTSERICGIAPPKPLLLDNEKKTIKAVRLSYNLRSNSSQHRSAPSAKPWQDVIASTSASFSRSKKSASFFECKASSSHASSSSFLQSNPLASYKVAFLPIPDMPFSSIVSGNGLETTKLSTSPDSLNFQPSRRLSYPDLSLSSFSSQSEAALHNSSCLQTFQQADTRDSSQNFAENAASQTANSISTSVLREEPFRTPLGFHIPSEKMQMALSAPENSEQSYWQYSLYRGPSGKYHTVKVHYCKNKESMETVSRLFTNEKVLGFDIEWMAQARAKEGLRRNVSLIQIASEERVALFHLARFPTANVAEDFVAPTFKIIMESSDITKVGVAIKGDSTRIRTYLHVHCQGLFELSHLYKVLKYYSGQFVTVNKICVPLALQVNEHLGLPLLKGDVQTSDWFKDLDARQIKYAASDSYAGFQLFHRMEAKRLALDPIPPRPAHAELNQNLLIGEEQRAAIGEGHPKESVDSFANFLHSETSVDELVTGTCNLSNLKLTDPMISKPGAAEARNVIPSDEIVPTELPNTAESTDTIPKELVTASGWAASYSLTRSEGHKIPPAHLRAYHLWHHQQYNVHEIANILRNPPLKISTVIEYICDAVHRGPLPADPAQFAKFASYGIQPYKQYHQSMLRAANSEMEKRKNHEKGIANDEENAGWWRTTGR